eukprot:694768-Alexandrium_andersonii.AAC.1
MAPFRRLLHDQRRHGGVVGPVTGIKHFYVRGEAPPGLKGDLTALADAASEFPYRIGVVGGKT